LWIGGLPMLAYKPCNVSQPLHEARDVAVEDRELCHENEQAQVERPLEEFLRGLRRRGKIDGGAIEGIIARGKLPLRGCDEIHEVGVAFEIKIRPTWLVHRNERQGEGVRR